MYIEPFDQDSDATQYIKYLKHNKAASEKVLSLPEQDWPTGKSHDIARQTIDECDRAYEDFVLDHGLFSADGQIAGFDTTTA